MRTFNTITHKTLLDLPPEILITLPEYIHNIEDYTNLSSTCRLLRKCLHDASPREILRLAASQTRTFFRPSPHFLVAATARQLGAWARQSIINENLLANRFAQGVQGVLDLCLEHCGLTMQRIRELHGMRTSLINPVTDLMDKCVGQQWYATPNFWDGGVDDAYTIASDPDEAVFHLAIYGELFGPDFEAWLDDDDDDDDNDNSNIETGSGDKSLRRLAVRTRLEYIKYCVPDWATSLHAAKKPYGTLDISNDHQQTRFDASREVMRTGPYYTQGENVQSISKNDNIALTWIINSSRWRPHWRQMRQRAGVQEFKENFAPGWWYADARSSAEWRQEVLEGIMVCQGLEGYEMIRPGSQERWIDRVRVWQEKIAKKTTPPKLRYVLRQATADYPYLLGDLRCTVSDYVVGT